MLCAIELCDDGDAVSFKQLQAPRYIDRPSVAEDLLYAAEIYTI